MYCDWWLVCGAVWDVLCVVCPVSRVRPMATGSRAGRRKRQRRKTRAPGTKRLLRNHVKGLAFAQRRAQSELELATSAAELERATCFKFASLGTCLLRQARPATATTAGTATAAPKVTKAGSEFFQRLNLARTSSARRCQTRRRRWRTGVGVLNIWIFTTALLLQPEKRALPPEHRLLRLPAENCVV